MTSPGFLGSSVFLLLISGCNHPIEIIGEGDVLSSTGTRNCYLEDFKADKPNCKKNTIVGLYQESYFAVPRQGWKFEKWLNYCMDTTTNPCSFDVSADIVDQNWGTTVPPLIAVFANSSSQVYVTFSGAISTKKPERSLSSMPSPSVISGNFSYDKSTIEFEAVVNNFTSIYKAPAATGTLQVAGYSYVFASIYFHVYNYLDEDIIEIHLGEGGYPTPIHGPAIDDYKPIHISLSLIDSDGVIFDGTTDIPPVFNGELPEVSSFEKFLAELAFRRHSPPPRSITYNGPIKKIAVLP